MHSNSIFGDHSSFLKSTLELDTCSPVPRHQVTPSGNLESSEEGVLVFNATNAAQEGLIISAGIHGDETAPIELLDKIISDIVTGELQPHIHCLFILGNPKAIGQQTRFIDENLNRLFADPAMDAEKADVNESENYEAKRALTIMSVTERFATSMKRVVHYDLHTAIRASRYSKFGVFPYLPARLCPDHQLAFLGRSGIEALLLQNKKSTTFSGWTSEQFNAESFTLELGKVRPFGENDLSLLSDLDAELRKLISNQKSTPSRHPQPTKYPIQFNVVHEIINSGDNFQLNIAEDTPNFTEYTKGYELWRDNQNAYKVGDEPEVIIFPNSRVKPGQRAGLVAKAGGTILI